MAILCCLRPYPVSHGLVYARPPIYLYMMLTVGELRQSAVLRLLLRLLQAPAHRLGRASRRDDGQVYCALQRQPRYGWHSDADVELAVMSCSPM